MTNEQVAEQVLDYWFAIEFLGQDSYDDITEKSKIAKDLKKYQSASDAEKRKRKQFMIFSEISEATNFPADIIRTAKALKMKTWGNLTFFVGIIRRQDCIEALAKGLDFPLVQQEQNKDDIPILSFQCTDKGEYIDHSLSLSPVLWALSQIAKGRTSRLSELLSLEQYSKDIKDLEDLLFRQGADYDMEEALDDPNADQAELRVVGQTDSSMSNEAEEELEESESVEKPERPLVEMLPELENAFITAQKIGEIYAVIQEKYESYVGANSMRRYNGIKYQLFKDEDAKLRNDSDNNTGLSHDFFSSDLKMIKESIEKKEFDYQAGMLSDLISYICAPYERQKKRERFDFVTPENPEKYFKDLLDILNIKNAPLGKWPSRYQPALMQQIAINIAVSKKRDGITGKKGNIFSVNGPPGTGKTTLLKEIIANHVVEKAVLLSKYEKPDDAFEVVKFTRGPLNGGYSQNLKYWSRFKNDRIADYGVLVTSCNNTAVENITKELPIEKKLMAGLKTIIEEKAGKKPDSPEMKGRLQEIRNLFSVAETSKQEELFRKSPRQGMYHEVYFTEYAKKLLGTDEEDADAWGLVAVPLGKRKNVSDFYYKALKPLLQDFILSDERLEARLPHYHKAREEFLEQLYKVRKLQEHLGQYGDAVSSAYQAEKKYEETTKRNQLEIESITRRTVEIREEIAGLQMSVQERQGRLNEIVSQCESLEQQLRIYRCKTEDLTAQSNAFKKQEKEAADSVTVLTKVFRRKKYKAVQDQINELQQQERRIEEEINEIERLAVPVAEQQRTEYGRKTAEESNIKNEQNREATLKTLESDLNIRIQTLHIEMHEAQEIRDRAINHRDSLLRQFQESGELKTGVVLDRAFMEKSLSGDAAISTQAQTENPWATEEYNLEREKLFYFSLQMTKEFLLSSKSCRMNLKLLGIYWGYWKENDIEIKGLHPDDRTAMMGSLLNTLFLFTPVVSSTFASVGRLLKDIKTPGALGTLIIDEAGQAQPQMAVGALFRARSGIIVGDPKQVEPIVKDDLNMLKNTYSEPVYDSYKDKSLSVQACADILNPFGTYYDNETGGREWVGCPLLVHRRCVAPMFEISNLISYNGVMKQKTELPDADTSKRFLRRCSQWINVGGHEAGNGNHYVKKQGEQVYEMVKEAFTKSPQPDLFIISPFSTVVYEIKKLLGSSKQHGIQNMSGPVFENWVSSNIGTVHSFQGKEAAEVIFLLGCDESVMQKYAVTGFVKSNLVNVAVTRAKYRLYIVGNYKVWRNNSIIQTAKSIMDTLALKNIAEMENSGTPDNTNEALLLEVQQLPSASSFVSLAGENAAGGPEFEIESDDFISTIDQENFLKKDLSADQYKQFGFETKAEFDGLPADVKKNLQTGMKLYYLLRPIYSNSPDLDASCCGILFCKGMELYLRKNFASVLKNKFPDFKIRNASGGMIELRNAQEKEFMLGAIMHILRSKSEDIGRYMRLTGNTMYTEDWLNSFTEKLDLFTDKRNKCCHPQLFKWKDLKWLLKYEFSDDDAKDTREPKIRGVFYESEAGKKLRES